MLDELEKAWYIALKDMKAYYFKPPTISWGILFPLAFAFAFSLRNPQGLRELAPGLLAMSVLFGTSSMSVGSIMFERRSQSFEQALQAPSPSSASSWARRWADCSSGCSFARRWP